MPIIGPFLPTGSLDKSVIATYWSHTTPSPSWKKYGYSTTATSLGIMFTSTNLVGLGKTPTVFFDIAGTTNIDENLTVVGAISGATLTTSGLATLASLSCTGTATVGSLVATNATITNLTLTSLTLGATTATTLNNVAITAPATTSTLTLLAGKTLTVNNTLTLAGSDGVTLNIGSNNVTFTTIGTTSLTLPTSGTVTALGNSTTGSGNFVLATSPTLTTPYLNAPILSGSLTLNEYNLSLKPTLTYNRSANGLTISGTAGETVGASLTGTPVYLKSDGKWWVSNATSAGTYPVIGITTTGMNANTSTTILLQGVVRNDSWSWTVGGTMYLSATGTLTQTAPSTTGQCVQVVGVALSTTHILFNPSKDYLIKA